MKQTVKKSLRTGLKRMTALLLVFVMVISAMASAAAVPVSALSAGGVNESLVSGLASLYDGDEERAKEDLETLYASGLITEDGSMVDLDIREDGKSAELADLAERIAGGEKVGSITINGNAVKAEQVTEIYQISSMLEMVKMLDQDVEITDEHVANFETLVAGLADGSIDVDDVISTGSISLKSTALKASGTESDGYTTGDMTLTDGNYTGPMLDGDKYEASHAFSTDGITTWYTDDNHNGVVMDGVVTLTTEGKDSYAPGDTVTVTASLNEAQALPVSFEWKAAGAAVGVDGDSSGTVTWAAGETENKTFSFKIGSKADVADLNSATDEQKETIYADIWNGSRALVINASNIQNALFSGNKSVWSKTISVTASDGDAIEASYNTVSTISNFNYAYGEWYGTYKYYSGTYYKKFTGNEAYTITDDCDFTISMSHNVDCAVRIAIANPNNTTLPTNTNNDNYESFINSLTTPKVEKKSAYYDEVHYGKKSHEFTFTKDELTSGIVNSKGETVIVVYLFPSTASIGTQLQLNSFTITAHKPSQRDNVKSVSVPQSTYHSGEIVPVTVEFDNFVKTSANTKLTVNGTSCSLLDSTDTETRKLTFGYTVKDTDTGAVNVTAISGLINANDVAVTLDSDFTAKSFGTSQGVTLFSDVKSSSIDWTNVKYGITDTDPNTQVVTVMLPFKSSSNLAWVASEAVKYNTSGTSVDMPIPGYSGATADYYVPGAYVSMDRGATRYPVYVAQSDDKAVALVTRFTMSPNEVGAFRQETLNLYMDPEIITGDNNVTKYVPDLRSTEAGTAPYAATSNSAPAVMGKSWTYYLKGGVFFDSTEYIDRGLDSYDGLVEDGFLKIGDDAYVVLQDAENPDRQYDVEIVVTKDLRDALIDGVRAEDGKKLRLWYQMSNRKGFTFTKAGDFTLTSSNTDVAVTASDSSGAYNISLTGTGGSSELTLNVINGSSDHSYNLSAGTVNIKEGKTPFLMVPEYSEVRNTLTNTDTDVLFSSNLTARNANEGQETTTFTATLYKAQESTSGYEKTGDALWTQEFESTVSNTVTHITVPGTQLAAAGAYALEIRVKDASVSDDSEKATLTATACIIAKDGPATVKLDTLESYYVTSDKIPEIGYTVTPSSSTVEYTIQKGGETVSERKSVSSGKIPFTVSAAPTSLKDVYTITVYARSSEEDAWSVDSMKLTVYNKNKLEIIMKDVTAGEIGGTTGGTGTDISGSTVDMDNHSKVSGYLSSGSDYQLSFEDLETLRTDMSLQKIISVNYGEDAWGMLSDRINWESSDGSTVSVDYKQGGIYSDIRNYSYTSYVPATDFLLVGKSATGENEKVTIKATHANTGVSKSFEVRATTLEDQLYVFQFSPQTTTSITYTNGKGVERTLTSNSKGELAVYEPSGIASAVMAMSESGSETYVGTLYANDLVSGEGDIASLQLYPCNNLRLRKISNVELTFLKEDGSAYTGSVKLRAGVYKNGTYCPSAVVTTVNGAEKKISGRSDIIADVSGGKLKLGFDASQFKHSDSDKGLTQLDTASYVIEYRASGYKTGYVILNAFSDMDGAARATDSVISLQKAEGLDDTPQITRQRLQQYENGTTANDYTRDVIDYTENIGISTKFSKAELYTDVALSGESVSTDNNDYTTYTTENPVDFALYTTKGRLLSGQTHNTATEADQITNLNNLDESTLYVFPFSSTPMARSVYTMTDEDMTEDGIIDQGDDPGETSSARVKMLFTKSGVTVRSETMPYGVSNLSHQEDMSTGSAKEIGSEVREDVMSNVDMGNIFKSIDVNAMLKKGFAFLGGLRGSAENPYLNMMIIPTEDPSVFHIMVFIGSGESDDKDDGLSVNYDPSSLYDDMSKFKEELDKLDDNDDSRMEDGDDESGEGKISFSFSGALHLVAKCDITKNSWDIDFRGGSVGAGLKASYEWSQNFVCGPVPVLVELELGFGTDLDLSFANQDAVRAMLLDAALELSVEAFAGVGFDLSLIKFKLGIEGNITAKLDYLYLTQGNKTGNQLGILGRIALIMEAKIALIKYKTTFASTGFNWTNIYGDYDNIKKEWEEQGFATVTGLTASGRAYTMTLTADGTALVAVEGDGKMEDRDYLLTGSRTWSGGSRGGLLRGLLRAASSDSDGFSNVQTNAYPYSYPVLADDGSMFLYISDNDNSETLESTVSYAVRNSSGGYDDKGVVDTSENSIPADSDVKASGSGNNVFAAWTKQMESPDKEMSDSVTLDDLGIMLNASEIYTGRYDGSSWKVERLTENSVADLAPTVASYNDKAIVAWRSLSATSVSDENAQKDITGAFDAENNINYRIYDGNKWTDAAIAYNGSAGTVNAIDSAMLSDGTSILVYTVRTGDDADSTETFYTVIDNGGKVVTTCSLTQNSTADTNVQVETLGDSFVLGWYAVEEAGNSTSEDGAANDAHDIRLAHISTNGSVLGDLPETLGVPAVSDSFRFSSPAGNSDISKLSIVWAELGDDQQYDVKAVRFCKNSEDNDAAISVSSPMTIAETGKYYTVDNIDSYTDSEGKVYVLALGSDYSSGDGSLYDTIKGEGIEFTSEDGENSETLNLLETSPVASIKLASAEYPSAQVEAEAETNLKELTPGVNLPVRFAVTNTGMETITKVTLKVGSQNKTISELSILPGQSESLVMSYLVPESNISDQTYTVTATTTSQTTAEATGTLVLNKPDVGINSMKLLSEGDGQRVIQVNLNNVTDIPLKGSGKVVKLALYKDSNCSKALTDTVTINDDASFADIDDGIYIHNETINVSSLIGSAGEIPDSGITVFAKAWVENAKTDTETEAEAYQELYTYDNIASLDFTGLLTKYGDKYTTESAIDVNNDGSCNISMDIRNNSLQSLTLSGVKANILDSNNKTLASVSLSDKDISLGTEETKTYTSENVTLTADGTPASVQLLTSNCVILDVASNGGECTVAYVELVDGKLPALPEATCGDSTSLGWFTEANGGDQVEEGDAVEAGSTIYAQFKYRVGNNVIMSDYEYTMTPPTPKMDNPPAQGVYVTYYWIEATEDRRNGFVKKGENADAVDAGTDWSYEKPAYPGTYYIRAKVSGEDFDDYNSNQTEFHVLDRTTKYEITVEADSAEYTYDGTEKTVSGFTTLNFMINGTAYTVSGLTAEAKGIDAGTYTVKVTGDAVVKDEKGVDVTSQFTIKTVNGSLTINKRAVTLTTGTDSKEYDGKVLTKDGVTVSGDGFAEGEGAAYSVTGSQKVVGSSPNSFTYKLNDNTKAENYTITEAPGTLSVTSRSAKYQISPQAKSDEFKYDGSSHTVSGLVSDKFTVDGNEYTVSGLSASAAGTDAGRYSVSITGTATVKDSDGSDVTDQFAVTPVNGSMTINKRSVTMTSATASKEYDGKALTNENVTVTGEGFADGEGASYQFTGSQTLVGTSENSFTYTLKGGTLADNYNITTSKGTLTVNNRKTKYNVTLKANSGEFLYDGKEKTVEGWTINGTEGGSFTAENGLTYTVSGMTAEKSGKGAGSYEVNITGTPQVKDADGNDVTDQFAVAVEKGTLTINKRSVTMTSATDSKEYDGTALTNETVTVTGDGFAEGEGASYNFTGSQTLPDNSKNTFSYTLSEGTNAENYEITKVEGSLTVTSRKDKYEITVTANSGEYLYDGTEKTVSGFETLEYSFNGVKYTVSGLQASVTQKDAGTYPVTITGSPVVKDEKGNVLTNQFDVKTVDGSLIIGKRTVNLTSATERRQYNGQTLTNNNVSVSGDGFASGEGATYNVTGKQKVVGSSPNSFTYTLNNGTNAANYTITEVPGTLTVTSRDAKYEISPEAVNVTKPYDGTAQTASGFKTLEFIVDGSKYTVSGLSASATGTNVGRYTVSVSGTALVTDSEGTDVSSQFAVTPKTGTLTISKRKVTLTSATDTKVYDGTPLTNSNVTIGEEGFAEGQGATCVVTGTQTTAGVSDNIFTYKLDNNTMAENYDISCVYGKLTVEKAGSTVTEAPEMKELTYSGETQELVTEGKASGGDMRYAVGTDEKTAPENGWSPSLPVGLNAGTYYVWYKVAGDANHNDTAPVCIAVTIEKADSTAVAPVKKNLTSTGSAQELVTAGSAVGGTMYYAVTTENTAPDESAYTSAVPEGTDTGTYYVWYKVVGDANHKDTEPSSITVKINAASSGGGGGGGGAASDTDQAAVDAVTALINKIPANVTLADKELIEAARSAYAALTEDQKKKVGKEAVDRLEAAEAAISSAETVKAVEDAIAALPDTINAADKDAVEAVRAAYDALTDDQKKLVSKETAQKLESAAKALEKALKTADGTSHVKSGATYTVLSQENGTVIFEKAKNKKSVKVPNTVKIEGRKFSVIEIDTKAFTGSRIRKVTVGENVEKINAKAFASSKVTTIIIKTMQLTKNSVKNSLKGSKVKIVKVKVGSATQNKYYVKTYKKIFTKANAGKKVAVR